MKIGIDTVKITQNSCLWNSMPIWKGSQFHIMNLPQKKTRTNIRKIICCGPKQIKKNHLFSTLEKAFSLAKLNRRIPWSHQSLPVFLWIASAQSRWQPLDNIHQGLKVTNCSCWPRMPSPGILWLMPMLVQCYSSYALLRQYILLILRNHIFIQRKLCKGKH